MACRCMSPSRVQCMYHTRGASDFYHCADIRGERLVVSYERDGNSIRTHPAAGPDPAWDHRSLNLSPCLLSL